MAEELQNLLEKIQKDGVEKANAEAAAILSKAKAEAARIIKEAEEKAAAAKADADKAAKDYAERAGETVAQAARDTVLSVGKSVTTLLESYLAKDVDAALADPAVAAKLAADAVRALVAGDAKAEAAAGAKLADALRAQFAADALKGVTVITDPNAGTGFSVKLDGGRVEHDFTGKTVADALAKRLRPDLAARVK